MRPEIHQEFRSRKNISGHAARICAQIFGVVLDMVVKLAGDPIFAICLPGCIKTNSKAPLRETLENTKHVSRIPGRNSENWRNKRSVCR